MIRSVPNAGRNGCGQAALAALLGHADARSVDAAHPPDTPWRLAGTTPRGLTRAARALGLRARYRWGAPDLDGLRAHLDAGHAAIVLVDVGRRVPRMHWAVARGADAQGIALANAPGDATWSWPRFQRAWRGVPLPGYRHGALLVER